MPVRPVAIGLVLCELVVVDEKTRNVSTISCFSRRVVDGALVFMPPFYIVATLVNPYGISLLIFLRTALIALLRSTPRPKIVGLSTR